MTEAAVVALPDLVASVQALAEREGFGEACTDEVGRLLRILARRGRRAGEIGTGYGVDASWIASGLAPGGALVTIELDSRRAAAVRAMLKDEPAVRDRQGDWRGLLDEPPFDLLFADGGGAKEHGEEVLSAVVPGGLVVIDDLTPGRAVAGDLVREFWLTHPGLTATELQTAPDHAILLAGRLP